MSEKHSMKISGDIKESKMEQSNKLEVVRINRAEFLNKYKGQVLGLGRNALNTRQGTGFSEREKEMTGIEDQYLKDSQQGELFVGLKDGVVVAFVALKRTTEGSVKKAVIEQLRYASGLSRPEHIVAGVLDQLKSSLEKEGIHEAEIESNGEHHKLSKMEGAPWFKKLFEIKDSNEDDPAEAVLDAHV